MTLPEIKSTPLSALKPHPNNPRTHSRKQIEQICASIKQFGFTSPLVIDRHGTILAGHARFEAARKLGLETVPTVILDGLSDAEKRAYMIAENKIAANAGWDRQLLASELQELSISLPTIGLDLSITAFETIEIDELNQDLIDSEHQPAEAPWEIPKNPVSQSGELWILGNHRIRCGDARDKDAFAHLMEDRKAAMVFTDPPYNLAIRTVQGRGTIKHPEFQAASGETSKSEFTEFLAAFMQHCADHSIDGAIQYVCHDWRHHPEARAAGRRVYGEPKNVVIWNKTNAGQGSFYRSQYEMILVFKAGQGPHINNFGLGAKGRNRSNVWTYAGANTFRAGRMEELALHPTVKPVALVADAMKDCSNRGDIVLDPFLGSGTTILAAERVGRLGYGLEIDPIYVDVAIKRWQKFTKRDAILAGTKKTFDEIAQKRTSGEVNP
jgi:DNA modification methylase